MTPEKFATPRERYDAMIQEICNRHHLPLRVVFGEAKDRDAVLCRREIALALREEGLSSTRIGILMQRDHTSVLNLLGTIAKSKWKQT